MADGEVEIELGAEDERKPFTLRCTPRAFKAVNQLGGFSNVFRRLAEFDADAYDAVIAAGLNKRPGDVSELVFKTGLPDLTAPLSEFVSQLMNGGRPIKADEPGGDEKN
ncbi:hypothetical protein [Pseudorhodoplanes sp.]|uniref:hypothetical protein n=1 Tax=Pseudorhodoplanes sp. TaxID=1934341 RepID=UPI002B66080D|nr:hypothetical protein [Pseudorhodoplanes sp.]HWV44132.1 hypothetical protein [Pseudorhodoplanes sp.]